MTKLFIFDVNTLVSAFIVGSYANASAFDRARKVGKIITSYPIYKELVDVFSRPKFDKYIPLNDRITFLSYLDRQMIMIPQPAKSIEVCRDPKDDKYLELAASTRASCLITGDPDLLVLHPFQNIPILNASDFLKQF